MVLRSLLLLIALLHLGSSITSSRFDQSINHGKCEKISVPLCSDMLYNKTIFPNLMGNVNQEDASNQIQQYSPLVKLKCSPDILLFLCSMFTPVCTILPQAIPPCKSLCLSAKQGCVSIMKNFNYYWPLDFDCDKFPLDGTPDVLCVASNQPTPFPSHSDVKKNSSDQENAFNHPSGENNFVCPAQLNVPQDKKYVLIVGNQEVSNCGAPCYKMFFDETQIGFSRQWIGLWAITCLLSCLFTLSTFCIDTKRFPYPERPMIYLCFSYLVIAAVYIVGYGKVDDDVISCNTPFPPGAHNLKMERTIKQGALHDEWRCTLLAMTLYFFTLASCLWWVMLCVSWFLSAGLKWGQEAIDAQSQWFHSISWVLPFIMTTAVLVSNKIDGDILSGICYVGLWDVHALRIFVLVPSLLCLVVGSSFLLLGFSSLIKIRSTMKFDGRKTDKLERLMARIGIFSTLYLIPNIIIVLCYFYEQYYFRDWMIQWQEKLCRDKKLSVTWQIPCRFPNAKDTDTPDPEFYVFMMKYFMVLVTGIFSGFWVWSRKTIVTWKNFYKRIIRSNTEAYV